MSWRPMATAPETAARLWLNHITLGPILAEGRRGRWYAPNAARQVWRWYRPAEPGALEPFSGWLPYEALEDAQAGDAERGLPDSGDGTAPTGIDRMPAPRVTEAPGPTP